MQSYLGGWGAAHGDRVAFNQRFCCGILPIGRLNFSCAIVFYDAVHAIHSNVYLLPVVATDSLFLYAVAMAEHSESSGVKDVARIQYCHRVHCWHRFLFARIFLAIIALRPAKVPWI